MRVLSAKVAARRLAGYAAGSRDHPDRGGLGNGELLSLAGGHGLITAGEHHSILMPASLMIFAYFATSAFINAVTSSGFEMKASDPCLTR